MLTNVYIIGMFYVFRPSKKSPKFESRFLYNKNFTLDSERFYQFEMNYLLSTDVCDMSRHVSFVVELVSAEDEEIAPMELFNIANSTNEPVTSSKWNQYQGCFQVTGGIYELGFRVKSTCEKTGNKMFVALDEIVLSDFFSPDQRERCIDFRVELSAEQSTQTSAQGTEETSTNEMTSSMTQETPTVMTSQYSSETELVTTFETSHGSTVSDQDDDASDSSDGSVEVTKTTTKALKQKTKSRNYSASNYKLKCYFHVQLLNLFLFYTLRIL